MYCNYLLTTKVTALQVVRTSFQHSFFSGLPRQSLLLFLTSYGIDPVYMSMIMCNLRGLNFLFCVLKKWAFCYWYQELQTANGIKKLVSVMLRLHMQTEGKVQTSCKMQNEDCRLGLKF